MIPPRFVLKMHFSKISKIIFVLFVIFKTSHSAGSFSASKRFKRIVNVGEKAEDKQINSILNYNNDSLFWTPPERDNVTETTKLIRDFEEENLNATDAIEDTINSGAILPDSKIDNQNETHFAEESNNDVIEDTERPQIPEEVGETLDAHDSAEQITQNSETNFQVSEPGLWEINEKIVLPRKNCNMELTVDDTHDTKLRILFEPLHANTSGKCCIVLNGRINSVLAVLIQDISLLSRVGSQGETLQVVLMNSGVDFVLKQYDENNKNQPQSLLLTESHRVYIILYYNIGTNTSDEYSHFNLEVFTYEKHQNYIQHSTTYDSHSYSLYKTSSIDNIYITTEEPTLFNRHYFSNNFQQTL